MVSTDIKIYKPNIAWKVSIYTVFSGSYSPVFKLNTEISLGIESEYGEIRTTKKICIWALFMQSKSW